MHLRRFFAIVFFAFFTSLSFAVASDVSELESDDWYYGKPIREIRFNGLKNFTEGELRGITSKYIGEVFSDDVFADLINRLFAVDYFEDISPSAVPADSGYKTVRIVIDVVEKPVVRKIRIIGNRRIRPSALTDIMALKEKEIFDESKVSSDEAAVRNYYLSKGYSEVEVSSEFTNDGDGVVVTYNVKEGHQTVIKEILFTGNRMVSARTLRSKLTMKKNSFFRRGGFQEATIEQDKKNIALYYAENGYVDINIINVTQESEYNEKQGRQEVTLTYNLEEGSRYTFDGITVSGNKVFSSDELESLVKMKKGDVFNATKLQEGITAIQSKYYDNGYWSNQFIPQVDRDSNAKTVGYRIYIQEGGRSHVESLTVSGNAKTKDEVILREMPIETGDIFSNEKVSMGLRSLYNLQYFSSILPEVTPGSEDNLVDINLNVQEQSTRSLQLGLTFTGTSATNAFPISLMAGVSDSNMFGEGKTGSVSASLASNQQSLTLGYGQNWLFGKPISNNISLGYTHSTYYAPRLAFMPDGSTNFSNYYMQFYQHKITVADSLARRWAQKWGTFILSGGISTALLTNIYDGDTYIPAYESISNYHNTWNPRNSVYTQVSFDGRDYFFNPSKGWFVSQRLTWIGLLPKGALFFPDDFGETEFILRSTTVAEKYFTLLNAPLTDSYNLKIVLAGISTFTMQRPYFDSGISSANQLSLDGMIATRGWEISDMDEGEGNVTWTNSIELRVPIFPNALAFDFFFDASTVKKNISDISDIDNARDWYFSFGPGLRLTMQQLPLRLFFVNNFKYEDGSIVWKDKTGDTLQRFMEGWHFVLSITSPNR